jgi:hypothetical protein
MSNWNELNVTTGRFEGFNDKDGIAIIGYEFGYSKKDEKNDKAGNLPARVKNENTAIFSNKSEYYGDGAKKERFAQSVIKYFSLWEHPLSEKKNAFEKTIVQTNWLDSQNRRLSGNIESKLLSPEAIDNFLRHVKILQPRLILFFGLKMFDCLQDDRVLNRFKDIMGEIEPIDGKPYNNLEKIPGEGRVVFQNFEKCKVVVLPHPSSGLRDDYIARYKEEIGERIQEVKAIKGI